MFVWTGLVAGMIMEGIGLDDSAPSKKWQCESQLSAIGCAINAKGAVWPPPKPGGQVVATLT